MADWLSIGGLAADVLGGIFGNKSAKKAAQNAYNQQVQFAQNQVQWRVADAEKAGVHPLAALGMNPYQVQPSQAFTSDLKVGDNLRQMSQDISRSRMATADRRERARLAEMEMLQRQQVLAGSAEETENMRLRNELLRSQIARMQSDQLPPPNPASRDMAPDVEFQPARPVVGVPGQPGREPANIQSYGYERTPDGGLRIVQSADAKQRNEDDLLAQIGWWWANRGVPSLVGNPSMRPNPLEYPPDHGMEWRFDPIRGYFRQFPVRRPWANRRRVPQRPGHRVRY